MKFSSPDIAISQPIPACREDEYEEQAWGIEKFGEDFKKITINRPKVRDQDVRFELKFCGICHTDVHMALNESSTTLGTIYPVVPGHELVGTVIEVGKKVTTVAVGDNVAMGCVKDSCLRCDMCLKGDENYCLNGFTHTYNCMKTKEDCHIGGNPETQNFGGYSGSEVVHEHFVYKLPDDMLLEKTAPLVCAGITMWSPLKHWGATDTTQKMNIGIAGIGGLGTMGIKLASKLGHRVVAISNNNKEEEMARSKGAHGYVVSTDGESVAREQGKLDLILNTIPAHHSIQPFINMLAVNGVLVQIGCIACAMEYDQDSLLFKRKSIAGSLIGGIPDTREVLDFCHRNDIYPDVELVNSSQLTEVFTKLQTGNSRGVRYVLDVKKSME